MFGFRMAFLPTKNNPKDSLLGKPHPVVFGLEVTDDFIKKNNGVPFMLAELVMLDNGQDLGTQLKSKVCYSLMQSLE